MIEFACHNCRRTLKAPLGTEGRLSRCKCGAGVVVPTVREIPTAELLNEMPPVMPQPVAPNPFAFTASPVTPPLPKVEVESVQFVPIPQPHATSTPHMQAPNPPPSLLPGTGYGISSMVVGVVALVLSPCGIVTILAALPCAVIGLILGIIGIRTEGRPFAITGVATSGMALVLCAVSVVLFAVFVATPPTNR